MTARHNAIYVLAAAWLLGCGGGEGDGDGTPTPADAGEVALRGACDLADKVGAFEIVHQELFSSVTGQVADSVNPVTVLEPIHTEGACVLMRKQNPFCDPPCLAGEVCTLDAACRAAPVNLSAGTLTVSGLRESLEIEPNSLNGYSEITMSHPPFEPGAAVELAAAGGDVEAFTLRGGGVTPVVVTDAEWLMVPGEDMAIGWESASDPDARLLVTMNVDQHGSTPVTMMCDLEDTGAATLPASLVDELIAQGLSGFARAEVHRRTVDSAEIAAGCVELSVSSLSLPDLAVDGFKPQPMP